MARSVPGCKCSCRRPPLGAGQPSTNGVGSTASLRRTRKVRRRRASAANARRRGAPSTPDRVTAARTPSGPSATISPWRGRRRHQATPAHQEARRALSPRRLRSRRRSRSVRPPHTPSSWRVASAYSRHSSRTGHDAHMAFAGSAASSESGKKMPVSQPRQAALARQMRPGLAVMSFFNARGAAGISSSEGPHRPPEAPASSHAAGRCGSHRWIA